MIQGLRREKNAKLKSNGSREEGLEEEEWNERGSLVAGDNSSGD
jgi:hypothetical protein